jgi:hypothetical protein
VAHALVRAASSLVTTHGSFYLADGLVRLALIVREFHAGQVPEATRRTSPIVATVTTSRTIIH